MSVVCECVVCVCVCVSLSVCESVRRIVRLFSFVLREFYRLCIEGKGSLTIKKRCSMKRYRNLSISVRGVCVGGCLNLGRAYENTESCMCA